ncbi:hypothetical protein [Frateuria soli]|uniref:hypothetical protein n=1 Tax=Frateuria soli TaxID=1542730 RepID=UPI001E3841BC|nr:hypothetical protein [Frateuria soli]UGB37060.1 hypothetical protein LQ771_09440 [Frateuria soli]
MKRLQPVGIRAAPNAADRLRSKQGETGHAMGDNPAKAPSHDLPASMHGITIGSRHLHRIHAMAHRIDAEHDQDGGHGAVVMLRPEAATSAPGVHPAPRPLPPRPARDEAPESRKPIWDKDSFGFWLTVCILISLAFSILWHSVG